MRYCLFAQALGKAWHTRRNSPRPCLAALLTMLPHKGRQQVQLAEGRAWVVMDVERFRLNLVCSGAGRGRHSMLLIGRSRCAPLSAMVARSTYKRGRAQQVLLMRCSGVVQACATRGAPVMAPIACGNVLL